MEDDMSRRAGRIRLRGIVVGVCAVDSRDSGMAISYKRAR